MIGKKWLKEIIRKAAKQALNEAWYSDTDSAFLDKSDAQRELGKNPLRTDVGNHSASQEVRQPSTFDRNGVNFKGEHIILSDSMFMIYKVKNFGNPDINGTLSLFGGGANGEKELRRCIDILNGAADRNGKSLSYRTITCTSNQKLSEKSGYMAKTFWEFNLGGQEWYILKPNPIQNIKVSKLLRK